MRKSVSQIILEFLQEHQGEWHGGFEFCNRTINGHFCGNSADRKARLMAERGILERKYDTINGTRYAFYRAKPIPKQEPKQLELLVNKAYNLTT